MLVGSSVCFFFQAEDGIRDAQESRGLGDVYKRQGGNRLPLGDQESVGGDAQRGVVVEAAPPSALEMPKPDLLLELLIVALDAPAQLGEVDQRAERDILGKGREPVFGRLFLAFGPLDQQPFLSLIHI